MDNRLDAPHPMPSPHFELRILPEEVSALCSVVRDDEVSFDQIARELAARPAIASLLLRTATSIGEGVREVRSLKHAVALLGLNRIREMLAQLAESSKAERTRAAG